MFAKKCIIFVNIFLLLKNAEIDFSVAMCHRKSVFLQKKVGLEKNYKISVLNK